MDRRDFLHASAGLALAGTCSLSNRGTLHAADDKDRPVAIGSRRELFVDDFLIANMKGAALRLHKPEPKDVAITCDKPWEGNTSAYFTVFRDGDRIRLYYRGAHFDTDKKRESHREVACYAESRDGLRFEKPELGLFEFDGSKQNNIVWDGQGTHNFTVFKDQNPDCRPEARYKALASGRGKSKRFGLLPFQSADGVRWAPMSDEPVITEGAFDSQNLAFWDPERKKYVDYHRQGRAGVRDIMTCVSDDFLTWTAPKFLEYPSAPAEHLYTNAIQPYFRAPHLLIGMPTRFQPATQQVEPILMTSRDGQTFRRWSEPLIPITAPADRDGNRSNYMAWGIVSAPGDDKHLSVYAKEAYYTGPGSRLRRFTFRVDGFASLHAPAAGGECSTRPLTFTGKKLQLNVATAATGRIQVELQDAAGQPLDGFALADCQPFAGDSLEHTVTWKAGADVSRHAGKPVRLRIVLQDADLFALRFVEQA